MEYSDYQKAIFKEVEFGSSNLVINAVAGSGKTTTIVECCKRLRCPSHDVKFLAFNKAIVDELETKIGKYADVSTMHSFALSIIKDIYNDSIHTPTNGNYLEIYKQANDNIQATTYPE